MSELVRYLESSRISVSKELLQNLQHVQHYARPLLTQLNQLFQEREDHFYRPELHVEEVSKLCGRLLPSYRLGENDNQINSVEAMVLLAGVWLHEVGLAQPGVEEFYNIYSARSVWDEETGTTRVSGLDPGLAPAIALLCRAHRDYSRAKGEVVSTLRPGLLQDMHWRSFRIRVPLLAAVLRTACMLEVFHHRRIADLGPDASAKMAQAWVKETAISALHIVAERGTITLELTEMAQHSELLRQTVRLWCEGVNRNFASYTMELLADFKLAYRENLVTLPQATPSQEERQEERLGRALSCFRKDAEQVVAQAHELGRWDIRTSGDGFPVLYRTLIDDQGVWIDVQIAPSIHYPEEPPTAKTVPRIARLEFQNTGCYEGSAIQYWKEGVARGGALTELCEELRRFESPEQTFAAHARVVAQHRRQWMYIEGKGNVPGQLTRKVRCGSQERKVALSSHPSYPLWHPMIEGLRELEAFSGLHVDPPRQWMERWRQGATHGDALALLLDWIEDYVAAIEAINAQ